MIARSTNVSFDDFRVSARGAFAVSSGCLSGSVVRDSGQCDFARLRDATVTCIESIPLWCPSVEESARVHHLYSNERDGVFRDSGTNSAAP